MNLLDVLGKTKIIPVAVFKSEYGALKVAELLMKNSFHLLEITLRTEIAYKCINEISRNFPDILLGSGSVLSKENLVRSIDSGAKFGVAPSLDLGVVEYALSGNIRFIPGVATPTELHTAIKSGSDIIKLFPATQLGGVNYIKAIVSPFNMINFSLVPTGGINEKNISEFLQADRVIACGASFMIDSRLIENGNFEEIENRIVKVKEKLSQLN